MFELISSKSHITFTREDIVLLSILFVWEAVWKIIALWKAARNKQLAWFIVMAILNTAGILEIFYLFLLQPKHPKHKKEDKE